MFFIYLLIMLINVIPVFGMRFSETLEGKYAACDLLKEFKRNGSYGMHADAVIKVWRNNNLTVCDCVKRVAKQKQNKALNNLIKEHSLSDKDVLTMFVQKNVILKEQDDTLKAYSQEGERLPEYGQSCSGIKQSIVDIINAHLKHQKANNIGTIECNVSSIPNGAAIYSKFDRFDEHGVLNTSRHNVALYLGKGFFDDVSLAEQDAVLSHEMVHAQERHVAQKNLISKILQERSKVPVFLHKILGLGVHSESFNKFARSLEAEADRVGEACGCGTWDRKYRFFTNMSIFYANKKRSLYGVDEAQEAQNDPHRPSCKKSLEWAETIEGLLNAEKWHEDDNKPTGRQ